MYFNPISLWASHTLESTSFHGLEIVESMYFEDVVQSLLNKRSNNM
jgi:hypothetical protein